MKRPDHKSEGLHTGPADYNEGPQAATRFRTALGHLASVPRAP